MNVMMPSVGLDRVQSSGDLTDIPAPEAAQAWRREMERVQMQGWLEHGLANHARQAPDLTGQYAQINDRMEEVSGCRVAVSTIAARLALSHEALAFSSVNEDATISERIAFIRKADERGMASTTLLERHLNSLLNGGNISDVDQVQISTIFWGRGTTGKTMALPRITLERVGAGMRVWLGLDSHDAQDLIILDRLVQTIREALGVVGIRLDSVMCNGRPLTSSLISESRGGPASPLFLNYLEEM
ncbi:hypothetical protein [Herbaspirillum seropedicae]|uniref:hypothetical protein n=1 Tax=Herbaspirillum seropedicae TaxID=964 RepID=UPI003D9758DC